MPALISAGPAEAFSHITSKTGANKNFLIDDFLPSQYALRNDIAAGNAITFATKSSGVDSDVVSNHAYILIGYNSQTEKFELYNPHGTDSWSSPIEVDVESTGEELRLLDLDQADLTRGSFTAWI